jgi:very-short-patch-repair endonuclease
MVKLRGNEKSRMYFGATPEIIRIAGELRRATTPSEKLLWTHLRKRRIDGFRFRRQHAIKDFVVDFFCLDAMLVIEVDGNVHNESYQHERDIERTEILKRFGLRVLRCTNSEIESDIEKVLQKIQKALENKNG